MEGAGAESNGGKAAASGAARLHRVSGEFIDRTLEALFQEERATATRRHCRLFLLAVLITNGLLTLADSRFYGSGVFLTVISGRLGTELAALGAFLLLPRMPGARGIARLMLGWMLVTTFTVAAMVTTHSITALIAILLVPMIYYLILPLPFATMVASGLASSGVLFMAYGWGIGTTLDHGAMAILLLLGNSALALTVARGNRLARTEWLATRRAQAIAAELDISRKTLDRMFQSSPVPMLVTDLASGKVRHANEAAVALFGENPMAAGDGTLTPYYTGPRDRERMIEAMERGGGVADLELRIRASDGQERIVMVKSTCFDTPAGEVIMAGLIDISDRKAIELSLEWMASTDPLTRLPNRSCFFNAARAEIRRAAREKAKLALMMIDLDHFKKINDSFGHQGGDRALKAFADLCLARLRDYDIVGRLGGEEFAILLPGADMEGATVVAETLRSSLEALVIPESPGLVLTASFGLSPVYPHETSLDAALSRADAALYAAKHKGRNRIVRNEGEPERRRTA